MSDSDLEAHLRGQVARVRTRSQRSPAADSDDVQQAQIAAQQVRRLQHTLKLHSFVDNLTPRSAKPRFLLVFDSCEHGEVVLKSYGCQRAGEVHLQRLWSQHGIRTVQVLASSPGPNTWLLMRRIPLAALVPEPMTRECLLALTTEVASATQSAHRAADNARPRTDLAAHGYRPSWPTMRHHLDAVTRTLSAHGYDITRRDAILSRAHADEVHLLHGDLGRGNVVRDASDGQLRLLDASAYVGPREFDAARWAARLGGAALGEALLKRWLQTQRDLDSERASILLGGEFHMEAGVREAVKDERGLAAFFPDARTMDLLRNAERLMP